MGKKHLYTISTIIIVLFACNKTMDTVFNGFIQPIHFPAPYYIIENNVVTKAGFELGKKLFYDPILSRNNTISCGTCHIPTAAFTQHGHDLSHGIDDRLGKRNSLPIMNLAFYPNYMWDGGIVDLDLQPIAPITAHEEMDESLSNVIAKLQNNHTYKNLFQNAFGSTEITTSHLMKALSQFMILCISSNSKYDSVVLGKSKFTVNEALGFEIVQNKCGGCHTPPLFTDHQFRNNGLGMGSIDDAGRFEITRIENDRYKFRVPSLRNLGFTAPYMHDGRFYTLDAVLDHYSDNIQDSILIDPLLKKEHRVGISLSKEEKELIKQFLSTLNDYHFITNPLLLEN